MHIDAFLQTIPPLAVYLTVGLVIGLESLGIPLPGEIALVTQRARLLFGLARGNPRFPVGGCRSDEATQSFKL